MKTSLIIRLATFIVWPVLVAAGALFLVIVLMALWPYVLFEETWARVTLSREDPEDDRNP